ncbi:MAG: TlpA family protein disulfide reductase [Dysgonamonadaceae bacterium]|jgi:thiol-disulfide isomerase/thioredoxin|nr:TlpA family protein disulfide reductase [Dysgonamonadaceae bacterium]
MKNIIILIAAVLLIGCSTTPKKEVHLKGQLKNMSDKQHVLIYNGVSSFIGKSRDIRLSVDENGYFDTIIPLEKPEYYSISRSLLYLTPGDDLEITLSQDHSEAQFTGKGSEANNYLKNRLYPQGGSFLESGKNVLNDFSSTCSLIDSLASIRHAEIDTLSGISEIFRDLEKARITADVINSYIFYMYYAKELKNMSSKEEFMNFRSKHAESITGLVNPLYKQITDDKYLDVTVVRNVFSYRKDYEQWFNGVEESAFQNALFRAAEYANDLDNGLTPEKLSEIISALPEFSDAAIVKELEVKIGKAQKLQSGQPAPDFIFTDTSGNEKRLSDLKGKTVYIDFWATWCGPCLAESPHFEKLAGKFTNKNIVFLPVSVDSTSDIWLKFLEAHKKQLPQYHSADPNLSENWNIRFIPRFVLIDKESKIINAYASRPSETEIEELLKTFLTD